MRNPPASKVRLVLALGYGVKSGNLRKLSGGKGREIYDLI
jgi:hypothetical protein